MPEIFFHFEEFQPFKIPEKEIAVALKNLASQENHSIGDLNYIICSDNFLLDLNRKYLQHDYFTDVITFDYSEVEISGDIFISAERVYDNANLSGEPFEKELCRVMAHGLLHLIGYGDKSPDEEIVMRKKEDAYLSLFPNFSVPRGTFSD